jgi:hypothetical protein
MSDTNKHQALLREALQISEFYAQAQFSLGIAYTLGEGVAKDEAEAVRWHRVLEWRWRGEGQGGGQAVAAESR